MKKSGQIGSSVIFSYASILISAGLGLIYTPYLVKQLGESDYSVYTIAVSIVALFMLDFGLSNSVTKYMSEYLVLGKTEEANRFYGKINQLYLALDGFLVIIFSIYYFCIPKIYSALSPIAIDKLRITFIALSIFNLYSFARTPLEGIMTAAEKFIILKIIQLLIKVLPVVITILLLYLGKGLYALVLTQIACGIAAIVIKQIYVYRVIGVRPEYHRYNFREYIPIFSYTVWVAMCQIGSKLLLALFPTILGMTSGSDDVAVYGIIHTLESHISTISYALSTLVLPRVSRIILVKKDGYALNELSIKAAKAQTVVCGLIISGFTLVGRDFINLWVGQGYSEVYYGLLMLIGPICLINTVCVGSSALHVVNKIKGLGITYVVCGILNVMMAYALSREWGVRGVCISFFVFEIVLYVTIIMFVKKNTSIRYRDIIKEAYLPEVFICAITGIIYSMVKQLMFIEGYFGLAINVIVICIIYSALAMFFFYGDIKPYIDSLFRKWRR